MLGINNLHLKVAILTSGKTISKHFKSFQKALGHVLGNGVVVVSNEATHINSGRSLTIPVGSAQMWVSSIARKFW